MYKDENVLEEKIKFKNLKKELSGKKMIKWSSNFIQGLFSIR